VKASMSTKFLSPAERLALQTGSVMQVYVSKVDGDNSNAPLQVSLKPIDRSAPVRRSESRAAAPGYAKDSKARATDGKSTIKGKRADANSNAKSYSTLPPDGYLLNNLKTGMKLTGTVQSVTNYAAYVSANVYRTGKGGKLTEIKGMLHKADIVDNSLALTQNVKGAKIEVYVKEVFKQSG
jgi:transcriptional accessory protein Tex/SPT6